MSYHPEDITINKVFDEQIMQCKLSGSNIVELLTRVPMAERLAVIRGDADDAQDGRPEFEGPLNVEDVDMDVKDDDGMQQLAILHGNTPKKADPEGKFAKWIEFAKNKFNRNNKLCSDPGSASGVEELLLASSIGRLKGTEGCL